MAELAGSGTKTRLQIDACTATCDSELWRLEAVIDRIDAKIAELRRSRYLVTTTIGQCRAGQCRFTTGPDVQPEAQA